MSISLQDKHRISSNFPLVQHAKQQFQSIYYYPCTNNFSRVDSLTYWLIIIQCFTLCACHQGNFTSLTQVLSYMGKWLTLFHYNSTAYGIVRRLEKNNHSNSCQKYIIFWGLVSQTAIPCDPVVRRTQGHLMTNQVQI